MISYNFNKISKVFYCGGQSSDEESLLNRLKDGMSKGIETAIHPKEIERQSRIFKRRAKRGMTFKTPPSSVKSCGNGKYDNSVIFVSGGFGFGTKDDSFFVELLGKINEIAKENNSYVLFVRGLNDNPSYFTKDCHIFDHLENVKLVEDYSLIKLDGFDCLCIGGSIPIDKKWKIEQSKRVGRALYFEGCESKFNAEALEEILKNSNLACIITSDAPTFIQPYIDSMTDSKWVTEDSTILQEITEHRLVLDSIYKETVRFDNKPLIWCFYSRITTDENINGIKYISSSSPHLFFDLQGMVQETFGVSLNGEKASPRKSSSKYKKISASNIYADEPANVTIGRTLEDALAAQRIALGHPVEAVNHPAEETHVPRWYEEAYLDNAEARDEGEGAPRAQIDSDDFTRWVHNYATHIQQQREATVITTDDIRRAEEALRRLGHDENIGITQAEIMNATRLANPGDGVRVGVANIGVDNVTVTE